MRTLYLLAFCFGLAFFVGARSTSAQVTKADSTLDNLQAAYNGESNAQAKYTAFAEAAQKEGYAGAAVLFRAAAQAEGVHAANHAKVISALGAQPKKVIEKVDVKSTAENLKAAIAGESYERDTMYPQFLRQARAEGNREAVRTFNFALAAETQHASLYKDALDNAEGARAPGQVYYVCPVCGSTGKALPDRTCPVCFTDKGKWEKVS